jgi:hypothetical protein
LRTRKRSRFRFGHRSTDSSIEKECIMKTTTLCLIGLTLAAMPLSIMPAAAQGDDAAYCSKLADTYQNYVARTGRHGAMEQDGAAEVAISKCHTGDYSGIAMLEKELTDARFDLPAR